AAVPSGIRRRLRKQRAAVVDDELVAAVLGAAEAGGRRDVDEIAVVDDFRLLVALPRVAHLLPFRCCRGLLARQIADTYPSRRIRARGCARQTGTARVSVARCCGATGAPAVW